MIQLHDISKRFAQCTALDGVNLQLEHGRIGVLFGPSGCGKSTLLRIIAGLERTDAGRVLIGGHQVDGDGAAFVSSEKRKVGMVFQDLALFPHLSVRRNIAFGIRTQPGRDRRVEEMLALTRLEALRDRLPHQLSGGEQQRVALARALAPAPDLLLLDEPFASLDAELRGRVREELLAILRSVNATVLMVTHDREEALSAAEDLMVMSSGRVVQAGTPEAVYARPRTREVASLLGESNLLSGEIRSGRVHCCLGDFSVSDRSEGPCELLIRSEEIELDCPDGREATVEGGAYYGHDCLVSLRLSGGELIHSRLHGGILPEVGSIVMIKATGSVHVFDAPSTLRSP